MPRVRNRSMADIRREMSAIAATCTPTETAKATPTSQANPKSMATLRREQNKDLRREYASSQPTGSTASTPWPQGACKSFASGCSQASRNPEGRPRTDTQQAALGDAAAMKVLDFACPRRIHSGLCEGVHMTSKMQAASSFEVQQLVLDIRKLRDSLLKTAKHSSKGQAIADYMMDFTPAGGRLHAHEMPWRVGSRRVCDYCWCAAADLIMDDRSGKEVIRKKDCFEKARHAYFQPLPTAVVERLAGQHGCSGPCMQCTYPNVVLVGRRSRASEPANRVAVAKEHAECWMHAFCDPECGNVQHRTDDEKDHVQGHCALDLWNKYRVAHEGVDGTAGRSTFYSAFAAGKDDKLYDMHFDKWSAQAECAECLSLKVMKARAQSADIQEFHQQQLDLHNHIARSERLAYGCNISMACSKPFGHRIWSMAQDAISTHTTSGPSCHAKPLRDLKGEMHAVCAQWVPCRPCLLCSQVHLGCLQQSN